MLKKQKDFGHLPAGKPQAVYGLSDCMETGSVSELPTQPQALEFRKKLAMPVLRVAEKMTRAGVMGPEKGCIWAFCLDKKGVGRAESQGSWMRPRLCAASQRGWAL